MAPKNNKRFASIVRETMSQLGLTQTAVAERGGPSDTTLRRIIEDEPVGISTATLAKIDKAFNWDPGSAAATLSGGQPTVSGTLRDSSGRVLNRFTALHGHEQHLLEQIVIGKLLGDAREFVHGRPGPDNNLLARSLDEAFELAVRALAREQDYSLADAEWRINEERAANSIRRQGDVYVVEDPSRQSDYELVAGADRRLVKQSKGERFNDEVSLAGEESQVDPGEED
ncbi:helix-turn-helix domain-containing protein [Gordonia sputi]